MGKRIGNSNGTENREQQWGRKRIGNSNGKENREQQWERE